MDRHVIHRVMHMRCMCVTR